MSRGPDDTVRRVGRIAEQWTPRLQRYAASILRDGELARDVVQDVLLKLCDRSGPTGLADPPDGHVNAFISLPSEEPAVRAWLFKAVRNRSIDLLRKEGRMSLLQDESHLSGEAQGADPDLHDPAGIAERHEAADAALAALDRLPPLQREALRLKFSGELSYKQIADTMGKSVSHVGVLIHEGLKTLRRQLA